MVGIEEVFLLKKTMTFVLSVFSLSQRVCLPMVCKTYNICLNRNVYSHRICSVGVADFQTCLNWEQCHQHNHSEGSELNPGQWQHLSVQSRICPCHCYIGNTEGDSEGSPVSSLCWEILSPLMRRYRHLSFVHGLTSQKYVYTPWDYPQKTPYKEPAWRDIESIPNDYLSNAPGDVLQQALASQPYST